MNFKLQSCLKGRKILPADALAEAGENPADNVLARYIFHHWTRISSHRGRSSLDRTEPDSEPEPEPESESYQEPGGAEPDRVESCQAGPDLPQRQTHVAGEAAPQTRQSANARHQSDPGRPLCHIWRDG